MRPHTRSTIVLTGFMGTGKTSVGRIVAAKLAREFVDMDAIIEAREGQTVSAIFETHGEAYFRAREADLVAELSGRDGLVIATGGGALVAAHHRAAFANAFVVCLDASVGEIVRRLEGASDRPLLAHGHVRGRTAALLEARRNAYAQIKAHVDTTGKTAEQVADEVIALFQAGREKPAFSEQTGFRPTFQVETPEGAYPVFVGSGLLSQVGAILSTWLKPGTRQPDALLPSAGGRALSSHCAIITNPRVGALYAQQAAESLAAYGFKPSQIEMPDGEQYKTFDTVRALYDQLIEAGLERRSAILALGGGVVGDVTGFVAATFLRGVPFVQLPTTLLAMVDASIGGKVGVDHPRGKNLIGAFKQPLAVIADPSTLVTLPDEEWRAGMAEVVKHGMIGDAGLFESLESGDSRPQITDWLERAMRVKVEIVARDPYERGERARLNLGHTFAHALERACGYQMRHGDAVAIGLMCATRLAARRQMCDAGLVSRLEHVLRLIGLPTHVPREAPAAAILDAMTADKKRLEGRLRFALPRGLGEVTLVDDVTPEDVVAAIDETRG